MKAVSVLISLTSFIHLSLYWPESIAEASRMVREIVASQYDFFFDDILNLADASTSSPSLDLRGR